MPDCIDEGQQCMFGDGVWVIGHQQKLKVINFKRSSSCMNITPQLRSTVYEKGIIFNLKIKIPFPKKHMHSSLHSSPSHRRKYKIGQQGIEGKTTFNTSEYPTVRDVPQYPSRKKQTAPTPISSARGFLPKARSTELSPRRKCVSRKGKQSKIVRNISILQQVVNDQDNIIKYTSNSNELKQRLESLKHLQQKTVTQFSEVDIVEIRSIQDKHNKHAIRSYYLANDFLRVACAKKIQRAWRRYKTKQLIRSYSNDIRKKDARKMECNEELTIKSARSHATGLKIKMKNNRDVQQPQTDRHHQNKMVKFQEDSIEKWQELLEKIKNQKNIQKLLQISVERTNKLKNQLGNEFMREKEKVDFFQQNGDTPTKDKIIKTKGYYQQEREKRREVGQKSGGSVRREERVKYFQNQMLKLENEISQESQSVTSSPQGEGLREIQQQQNIKLRKKLQIFKQHLPQIQPFTPADPQQQQHTHTKRIDIATIIRRKTSKIEQQHQESVPEICRIPDQFQLATPKQKGRHQLSIVDEELSSIQTHREWTPTTATDILEDQPCKWIQKLMFLLKQSDDEMVGVILQELILESLIEISQSQKLVLYIKGIHEKMGKKVKKPEGIVTSHASIKDYLNYFINYIYEHKLDAVIQQNLLKPIGPTPSDVLKYFRGEDLPSDPQNQYVMSIKFFNQHWQYANQFIYFDPKWQDPKKQEQRVSYLKQLTKVFFRSIFDCFNQSLEQQRIYGSKGKPYPWSIQKIKLDYPIFKKSLLEAFQRVIKMATVFSGVFFQDKQHCLDKRTMDDIQQENMVKLILLECEQDQPMWNFYQDEMVEAKLQLCNHIQQKLLTEMCHLINLKFRS